MNQFGASQIQPLRVKGSEAMAMLNVSRATLGRLLSRGLFTVFYPNGARGRGKRIYLLTEEVRIYAEQGEDALVRHREKQKGAGRPAKGARKQ